MNGWPGDWDGVQYVCILVSHLKSWISVQPTFSSWSSCKAIGAGQDEQHADPTACPRDHGDGVVVLWIFGACCRTIQAKQPSSVVCFGCPEAIEESVSVQVGPGYASSHTIACEGSAKRLGFPSAPRSHVGLPSPAGSWNQGTRGRSTNQSYYPLVICYIAIENHHW